MIVGPLRRSTLGARSGSAPAEGTDGTTHSGLYGDPDRNREGADLAARALPERVALSSPITNLVPQSREAVEPEPPDPRYVGPAPGRMRVTVTRALRAEIVDFYHQGLSSLEVAEVLGIAKSTVLRVLRAADQQIRPWGVRYR